MRAAEAALPFERPKLAAVLSASMDDFGDKLEKARLRALMACQLRQGLCLSRGRCQGRGCPNEAYAIFADLRPA
jgi:hypothetical protein